MKNNDTRYPYTYACDLIRVKGGYSHNGTNLSRSNASQIRQLIGQVLEIDDEVLARKLADYYLANQQSIDDDTTKTITQTVGIKI